jgi:hypothetical protein
MIQHSCGPVMMRRRSRLPVLRGLVTVVLTGLVLVVGGAPANADATAQWDINQSWSITNFVTVRILVGADDVRSGTAVWASVHIVTSSQDFWRDVNMSPNLSGYGPGALLQQKIYLDHLHTPDGYAIYVSPRMIRQIKISYRSGHPDPFSTADNWNMDRVRVLYPKWAGDDPPLQTAIDWTNYNQLMYGEGSPLNRFTENPTPYTSPTWTTTNPSWTRI